MMPCRLLIATPPLSISDQHFLYTEEKLIEVMVNGLTHKDNTEWSVDL